MMYRTGLSRAVAKRCGFDYNYVKQVIDAAIECINDSLLDNEDVTLDKLGTFYVKKHHLVCGFDKKRYETKKVAFKPSKTFHNILNRKEA